MKKLTTLFLLALTSISFIITSNCFAQVMVKDINLGSWGSSPIYLTNVNGTLYFKGTDGTNGTELWKSDGTDTGTVMVKDIYPGGGSSMFNESPSSFTNVNGTLFFYADNKINGGELWKSDGTTAGTVMVKDIYPGSNTSSASYLTNVNGILYFGADDGTHGWELWKSDGTDAGTVMVKDINPGSVGSMLNSFSDYSDFINVNGTLFFVANDGINGHELWKSDGTAAGTVMVKDIYPGTSSSMFDPSFTNINGIVYFNANNGTNGEELWKSDGTAAGTVMVKDICPGSGSSMAFPYLTNVNGTLFFMATNGTNGRELWKSNGTTASTVMVKDIYPGTSNSIDYFYSYLTDVNGTLFFMATNGTNGYELWKSDGTTIGTVMVKDIYPGPSSSMSSSPYSPNFINVNSTLFFVANDGTNGTELWKSNGTAASTVMVKDIVPNLGSSYPSYLTDVNGTLFFSAADDTHGDELWKYDVTTGISSLSIDAQVSIYPNPFSHSTTISIGYAGNVENAEIAVYDVVGRKIKNYALQKGQEQITVSANEIGYGVFICQFNENGKTLAVKKMVVIK